MGVLVAACVSVLPSVANADPFGSSSPPAVDPNNHASDCPDLLILAVNGGADSSSDRNPYDDAALDNSLGNLTVAAGAANSAHPGSLGWVYVPYASTYGLGVSRVPTYQEAIAEGVASTNRLLDGNKTACGDTTKYALVGYSMGAEVVERVAVELGHRDGSAHVNADDIAGVALVGDPYRAAGTPSLDAPGPSGGGFVSAKARDYGALDGKIVSACRVYDISCDAPRNIAILDLALAVLGQMHFTLLDPLGTVSDLERTAASIAQRAVAEIVSQGDWFESEESLLDVLIKVADQTYRVDYDKAHGNQLTPGETLKWAMGPGWDVISRKVNNELTGFARDNSGVPELITRPYIVFGVLQHVGYWKNFDGRYPETAKLVDWITALAAENRSDRVAPQQDPRPERGGAGSTSASEPAAFVGAIEQMRATPPSK
ncbi:cutinase family protein [Rhodococcus olei]|uniref:cutinase family protein n=1 Tax=Rhodococcus olei TaxID=2161675 RepID=UPI0031EC223C